MHHGILAYQMARMASHHGSTAAVRGTVQIKRGAEILEGPYPKDFLEFVGQDVARSQIMAAITSAARRNARLDHMLLASGLPGIGKTTLARLAAAFRDVGFVEAGGLINDKEAINLLRQMQDGDVLFIDEIHRLFARGKAKAEWLLTLMQDGTVQLSSGSFKAPDVTIIAATTDAQRLPETILHRFPIQPVLVPYTDAEAVQVAQVSARRLGFGDVVPMPEPNGWLEGVAAACDNNPRRMEQLLRAVRDVALSTDNGNLTEEGYDIGKALEWSGLTTDGLTTTAQEYLVGLFSYGGSAGIATLKALLNEEQLGHTEKHLIQRGYIQVTARGRELTDFGAERAAELAKQMIDKMEEQS